MSRSYWLMGAALVMFVAAPAVSQQPAEPPQANGGGTILPGGFEFQQVGPNITFRRAGEPPRPYSTDLFADPMPSKYWLGIYCSPVPPALRAHVTLPEKQGLLALLITKDSPAAKAGIAQYDILLRAGGKPLAEPRDLLAAVDAAKESKLKIDLIRGGKPRTIEVTPAKRPAPTAGTSMQVPEQQADWNTIESWLENMTRQGSAGPQPPAQFRIFHPGAIVPRDVLTQKPLPTNMSVAVTKEGDQPAKVKVQRGNDKWEITEKELDKLPPDVRPFVEQMLGRGMVGSIGGWGAPNGITFGMPGAGASGGTFPMTAPPQGTIQSPPFPGTFDQQLMEKRFDEINRRMDRLFKMMEQLSEGHGQHAAPEHHPEK